MSLAIKILIAGLLALILWTQTMIISHDLKAGTYQDGYNDGVHACVKAYIGGP